MKIVAWPYEAFGAISLTFKNDARIVIEGCGEIVWTYVYTPVSETFLFLPPSLIFVWLYRHIAVSCESLNYQVVS